MGVYDMEHYPQLMAGSRIIREAINRESGVLEELWDFFRPGQIPHVLRAIGYERILFGSDFPEDIVRQVTILGEVVPEERQADVFAGNAKRLEERFGWWAALPSSFPSA